MSLQLPPFPDVIRTIRSTTDSGSETADHQVADALSLLFEPSPVLDEKIVPLISQQIQHTDSEDQVPKSYASLIDMAIQIVSELSDNQKASFIAAHPRIGEVKGLSAMSAVEQGQTGQTTITSAAPTPTPVPVLERLARLNAIYERRYPGLVYITFVNGRTRAQIRDELEIKLRSEGVLPAADGAAGLVTIAPHEIQSDAWRAELGRAIDAIRDIAQSRLEKLGVA